MEAPPTNLKILDDPPFREIPDLVNDVFHRINRVLPEDQEPLTIGPAILARVAIGLMNQHGYSQLPIVSASGSVLGVFSYRSFAAKAGLASLGSIQSDRCAPGDLPVDEYLEVFQFARVSDDLQSVFPSMDADNGILIGSPTRLQGVLTPMDFLRYLYQVASPFVHLSEIELALRELIMAAVTSDQLEACIQQSLTKAYTQSPLPKGVKEMTFDNYKTLISDGRNWELFHPVFGGIRQRTAAKLEEIRELRNDVFHFKRDLNEEDRTILKAHRDWILLKAKIAETTNRGGY
jgi:hypothetical protein